MKGREYKPIVQAFADFQENQEFWRHRTPGLAMFYHGGHLHTFEVPRAVPNQVIVADSFHLKPIFRVLQTTDRFNILTLDRNTAHAFEANRDSIMPVNLSDMPIHKKEHDKGARTRVGEQHMSGFGRSVIAIHDVDEKAEDSGFFHEVDRFVEENLSKQTHLPLVLVAVSEHQGTFRKVAKNHLLLADGVTRLLLSLKNISTLLSVNRSTLWKPAGHTKKPRQTSLISPAPPSPAESGHFWSMPT